ncbi:tRNA (guanine-N(7)-)-methyltransferase [compost metagenome]
MREVRRVLEPGGVLVLATDDPGYQARMQEVMEAATGFATMESESGAEGSGEDGTTIFERKWSEKGRTARYFRYRRLP